MSSLQEKVTGSWQLRGASQQRQVLTRHQRVVIRVGEAGEVWGHVIHLHPHVHDVPKARQTLQLAVVDVVEAKTIEQKHQELAVGRGGGGERQEGGEDGGQDGGQQAAAPHGRARHCQDRGRAAVRDLQQLLALLSSLLLPPPALKLQHCPACAVGVGGHGLIASR